MLFHRLPNNAGIASVLGYPPELESKTTVMKTPHTSLLEQRESKLAFSWKLHPYWLAFIVLEGTMHAIGGEK